MAFMDELQASRQSSYAPVLGGFNPGGQGGNFNVGNPAAPQSGGILGNFQRIRAGRGAQDPLSRARGQGLLDDPRIMAMLERRALRTSRNRRRSSQQLGRLLGLDSQAQRQNILATERGAGEDVTNLLGEGQLQNAFSNRDYARQLFGGQLDFERQLQLAKMQQDAQKGGGFGSFLGGIVGTGLGSLTGGLGSLAAPGVGRAIGKLF